MKQWVTTCSCCGTTEDKRTFDDYGCACTRSECVACLKAAIKVLVQEKLNLIRDCRYASRLLEDAQQESIDLDARVEAQRTELISMRAAAKADGIQIMDLQRERNQARHEAKTATETWYVKDAKLNTLIDVHQATLGQLTQVQHNYDMALEKIANLEANAKDHWACMEQKDMEIGRWVDRSARRYHELRNAENEKDLAIEKRDHMAEALEQANNHIEELRQYVAMLLNMHRYLSGGIAVIKRMFSV